MQSPTASRFSAIRFQPKKQKTSCKRRGSTYSVSTCVLEFMSNETVWKDTALAALLQEGSARLVARPFGANPDEFDANRIAKELLGNDPLVFSMYALAPHATEFALEILDDALLALERADFFNEEGKALKRPRIFGRVVKCFIAATDGRCLIKVCSAPRIGRGARASEHVVLVSGVHLMQQTEKSLEPAVIPNKIGSAGIFGNDDMALCFWSTESDDTANGNPYFDCDCVAFAFKHAGEPYCKHILAAGLVIALNLASIKMIPDEEFIKLAKPV